MKVVCTQENLKMGLAIVGRIISPNNSLPVLSNVLLKSEGGQLKISSTNLELAITTKVRCKVEQEGGVTVFSKTISDLVNNLPNKNVALEAKNNQLGVEAENYHTSIKTLSAEEFPLIPRVEAKHRIILPSQDFKSAIEQVVFAVSNNQTQPEISGVLLSFQGDVIKAVATDRYRLAEKKLKLKQKVENSSDVIVPQKTILEVIRVIGAQKADLEILINETQIAFVLGETEIVSRVIDGQYPDYKQIIPEKFTATIICSRVALGNALKAGGIFSQSSNSVLLKYQAQDQILTVASESAELGKTVVDIACQIEGEKGEVILNYHYILDCLNTLSCEKVLIKITNDSAPSLLLPEGQDDYIYLVMPIKN